MSPAWPRATTGSPRDDDIDLEPDELGRDLDEALAAAVRPTTVDRDGATLDQPSHPVAHKSGGVGATPKPCRAQEPDGRQLPRLLRPRRQRPRRRRAAEQGNELAALQLITSSARSEDCCRHVEAERLGGLEIDDRFEFRRPFDRQVGRLGALQNLVHERRGAPEHVGKVHPIGR